MTDPGPAREQPLWQIAVVEAVFLMLAAGIIWRRGSAGDIVVLHAARWPSAVGLVAGGCLGAMTGAVLLRSPLRDAVVRGVLPMRPVTASMPSIVAVGLLAGAGEELLFRAALQPWVGLWCSAILFGLAHAGTARLHEGLTPGKAAYLVAAIAAGVLLGLLYASAGLLASMSAHAAFDIAILLMLAPAIARAAEGGAVR